MAAPVEGEITAESPMNRTEDGSQDPVFSEGQLSFLGHDVEEIPSDLISKYAARTVRLDLSFNRIRTLAGLEHFTQLSELILDNNELGDDVCFPQMNSLTTLYLNKNKFMELDPLMEQLKTSFPQLCYLSLLGNAACPNQLSSTEKDEEDYQRYRYYVLFHLPQLKFLDSSVIHTSELAEAKRRGQYMQVIRPVVATEEDESSDPCSDSPYTPLPSEPQRLDSNKHLGFYSKTKYTYYGRHSEGNRFIRNKDL